MADMQAIQQMLQQLNDRVAVLEQQNATLIRANQVLEQQAQQQAQRSVDLAGRLGRQETQGPAADTRGGLYDKRLQEPEKLRDTKDFKEWSEEFLDFM